MSSNRRSFLKGSALDAAAVLARAEAQAPEPSTSSTSEKLGAAQVDAGSPVLLVNLLQGTESTPAFSRGNTLPIAARPFGMAHWTLQSRDRSPWMFAPLERRLQGFRCTHQLSPWLGDYGQAIFMPCCGEGTAEPTRRSSSWKPEQASLHPHSIGLELMRYSIDAELVPTERCAVLRATYQKPGQPARLIIDVPLATPAPAQQITHTTSVPVLGPDARSVRFVSTVNEGGVPADFGTYYVVQLSEPCTALDSTVVDGHALANLHFAPDVSTLEARIGTSFISFEQATHNLAAEAGNRPIDQLRADGAAAWNHLLDTIQVQDASPEQRRTLYSCLYRTLLFPRVWHEVNAHGAVVHRSPYNGQVVPGVMYADHGYWDVYRAWYPMMTLLFPERLAEILQAWVNAYKEGGWLPQFPCPGYRACMTGSLIDSVFGDAAAKGLQGFDLATAYEGLRKHATEPGDPDKGYGRRGLKEYLQYGFCPAGMVDQSVAETVDAAYGDFCIAQVAKALGKDDAKMFLQRSENWKRLFDPQTGFLRGKHADGTWLEPFDPIRWGNPYVEGSAWQHRFDAPQDLQGLAALLGGDPRLVDALDAMLARLPEFDVGAYGEEIHEMSEMAAVNFGQYAHSNQPVHHVLYVYTVAGRRDRTRHWTGRVLRELYSPDQFAGDEDTGSMAAWYVLSALGVYPVCPGKAEYALGHPLFENARVGLPGGKSLEIQAVPAASATDQTRLNGSLLADGMVAHAALAGGGRLEFH